MPVKSEANVAQRDGSQADRALEDIVVRAVSHNSITSRRGGIEFEIARGVIVGNRSGADIG